jgi:Mn-dependent DtxR family transcriptional regulator
MPNYTEEQILKAISGSRAIMSTIADRLGCTWHTAKKYVEKYPNCVRALEDETESLIDTVENKAIELMEKGDSSMVKYYLSTKGKKRGYSEKHEIEHSSNPDKPISINITPVSSDKK